MASHFKSTSNLTGHYSKKELEKRKRLEEAIKGDNDNIPIPKFIIQDPIAVEEFLRIKEELVKVGVATNVDSTLLGIYADSYSKYVQATENLEYEELVEEFTNKSGATNRVINPNVKLQQQYATMIMKISTLYGLDPASRGKIAHLQVEDDKDKQDPLMDLLKGLKGVG